MYRVFFNWLTDGTKISSHRLVRERKMPWLQVMIAWMRSFNSKRRLPDYWNDNFGKQESGSPQRRLSLPWKHGLAYRAPLSYLTVVGANMGFAIASRAKNRSHTISCCVSTTSFSETFLVGTTALHCTCSGELMSPNRNALFN